MTLNTYSQVQQMSEIQRKKTDNFFPSWAVLPYLPVTCQISGQEELS